MFSVVVAGVSVSTSSHMCRLLTFDFSNVCSAVGVIAPGLTRMAMPDSALAPMSTVRTVAGKNSLPTIAGLFGLKSPIAPLRPLLEVAGALATHEHGGLSVVGAEVEDG